MCMTCDPESKQVEIRSAKSREGNISINRLCSALPVRPSSIARFNFLPGSINPQQKNSIKRATEEGWKIIMGGRERSLDRG